MYTYNYFTAIILRLFKPTLVATIDRILHFYISHHLLITETSFTKMGELYPQYEYVVTSFRKYSAKLLIISAQISTPNIVRVEVWEWISTFIPPLLGVLRMKLIHDNEGGQEFSKMSQFRDQ